MQYFRFSGDFDAVAAGFGAISEEYGFSLSAGGYPVEVQSGDAFAVCMRPEGAKVTYSEKPEFFRALSLMAIAMREGKTELDVCERARFDTCGIMVDLSHGAILTVESLKSMVRKLAMMGNNMLMLYTEESYELPGYPYFGYMRGRLSSAELHEVDEYADLFGVEIIPAMQTLGHLANTLHWRAFSDVADTEDCLFVGEEKTYRFIGDMLRAISAPFRSRRIHIGFDETMSLGLGNYMNKHGYRPRIDIFTEHLDRVCRMCRDMGLEPIIWPDMFFHTVSATGYADAGLPIPKEVAEKIPKGVALAGCSYGRRDAEKIRGFLDRLCAPGNPVWLAGATIDWSGFCVDYKTSIPATNAFLSTGKSLGIRDALMTTWGDDSTERDPMLVLLGAALYAEHRYTDGTPNFDFVRKLYDFAAISDSSMVLALSELDTPGCAEPDEDGNVSDPFSEGNATNPTKYLFWQDPLLGLFDAECKKVDFPAHFRACAEKIEKYLGMKGGWDDTLRFYLALANTLVDKCDIGVRIKAAYDRGDRAALRTLAGEKIPALRAEVEKVWKLYRTMWFTRHKAFGLEVIDRRFGTLAFRLDAAAARLTDYIEGRIPEVEELIEERRPVLCNDKKSICFYNDWLWTSTAWGR